jgi:hypothetical protein
MLAARSIEATTEAAERQRLAPYVGAVVVDGFSNEVTGLLQDTVFGHRSPALYMTHAQVPQIQHEAAPAE